MQCRTPVEYNRTLVGGEGYVHRKRIIVFGCSWLDTIRAKLRSRPWNIQATVLWPDLLVIDSNSWCQLDRTHICRRPSGRLRRWPLLSGDLLRHYGHRVSLLARKTQRALSVPTINCAIKWEDSEQIENQWIYFLQVQSCIMTVCVIGFLKRLSMIYSLGCLYYS